jgi:maltooligosyltrehalose trehalohydrolase
LVGYLQNHDQVGNRAAGERISQLTSLARAKVGAALVMTSPFIPLVFQGEEWAASSPFQYFTDHADPDLGRAVSEGRRSEFAAFGWSPDDVPDPQDRTTFDRSVLAWGEVDEPGHADMLAWYRDLIALRRATPALLDGRLDRVQASVDTAAQTLLVTRGAVVMGVNLGSASAVLDTGPGELALASSPEAGRCRDGTAISLPPDSVAILRR